MFKINNISHKSSAVQILLLLFSSNKTTVKVSCPEDNVMLSSRVELQPLSRVCLGCNVLHRYKSPLNINHIVRAGESLGINIYIFIYLYTYETTCSFVFIYINWKCIYYRLKVSLPSLSSLFYSKCRFFVFLQFFLKTQISYFTRRFSVKILF